jgi:hypothetical protein
VISAPTRQRTRAAALVGAIAALLLLPGLASIGVAAEPAPPVRFRPTQLPLGAEPVPAWVASAHGDQFDDELRRAGEEPISLALRGAAPLSVREARAGWLVDYVVWGRPVLAPHRLILVRRDGTKRVVAQRTDPVQVVSADGTSYVTKREVFDRRQRRTATVLSTVRIDDGRVSDRLTFPGRDTIRVRFMSGFVLLDRVAPATRGGDRPVTTIEWHPASGKATTRWRRTAHRTDLPGIGRVGNREIVVPDRRKGQGQTVADLASHRSLWRLRVGERAMRFGRGKLLTLTDKAGPNDVRTLRVREARTGRLLATYRGTIFDSYVRWESARKFVVMAADGLESYDGPGGGSTWANPSLVRCSVGAGGCERVDAEFDYTSISVAPGTTY